MPFTSLTDAMGDIFSTSTSEGPDPSPELFQQAFEALRSGDISKLTETFETLVNSTVTLDTALRSILESLDEMAGQDAQLHALSKKIVAYIMGGLDDFVANLRMPASAPGHAERVRSVSESIEQAQQLINFVGETYGVKQGVMEPHLAVVRPYAEELWVLIGDVAELYPTAIEAVVLNLSAVLLPEAMFIRSLVILYCFGPCVLGKDAIGGWVFKQALEVLKAQAIIV
ncbi:hypothetical protein PAXINDRAFT_21559 [Paxillus involutus ATCC 200175]|uniref:Uncharacterized protein n=1 Tax=Paxillus involutus ATCC 200175 TaxID=664439 RepID=A0A0C9TAG7_PAXIN|nr:hypothetical protein PAXINDRAFT_21559 [Paxillus involutus ATCC 200175]